MEERRVVWQVERGEAHFTETTPLRDIVKRIPRDLLSHIMLRYSSYGSLECVFLSAGGRRMQVTKAGDDGWEKSEKLYITPHIEFVMVRELLRALQKYQSDPKSSYRPSGSNIIYVDFTARRREKINI